MQDQKQILSFIIPVYNVQEYVEKCLLSIVRQDIPVDNYEIIVVNDGSTDDSLRIVERLSETYSSIKIIDQENQGLSGARNSGLREAKGKYVWFVDSDDSIKENCLAGLLARMESEKLDLLLVNLLHVDEKGNTLYRPELPELSDRVVNGTDLYRHLELSWNVCRYIIRKKILIDHQLQFISGVLFEDGAYLDRLFYYVEKAGISYEPVYYYLKRGGSIMTTAGNLAKRQASFLTVAESSLVFMEEIDSVEYKQALEKKIISYLCQVLHYQTYNKEPDFRTAMQRVLPLKFKIGDRGYRIRIYMINHFPLCYGWIMRLKSLLMKG